MIDPSDLKGDDKDDKKIKEVKEKLEGMKIEDK